jgi:tetratricopeptide (TPR) repeat protein
LDKALHSYLSSGRYKYYPIPTPPGIASSGYSSKPLSPLDTKSVLLIQREGGFTSPNPDTGLPVIEKRLQKSVELDPEFADAYSLLAFTYMSEGKHDEAMQTMIKAVKLNPRNDGYVFNLDEMCLMNRKYDDAIALFTQLQKSGNEQIVAQAQQALSTAQQAKQAEASGASVQIQAASGKSANRLLPSADQPSSPPASEAPTNTSFRPRSGS